MIFAGDVNLEMPDPDWNDSLAIVRTLITALPMVVGSPYSYIREPKKGPSSKTIQRFSFTCSNIEREKLKEILGWFDRNISTEITITFVDTSQVFGYFVNAEHVMDVIKQGHYFGDEDISRSQFEGMAMTFEFEGYIVGA